MHNVQVLTARSGSVKFARRLRRREDRVATRSFLVEGPQTVHAALRRSGCVRRVFAAAGADDRYPDLVQLATDASIPWLVVDAAGLATLAETVHPQGIVAECAFLEAGLDILDQARLAVVLADCRDPGNAGTVVRAADAAGADAVVLAGTSVDPYNGKVVRASAGSLFHIPVVSGVAVTDAVVAARRAGLTVIGAAGDATISLDRAAESGLLRQPTLWLFGNEARGLTDDERGLADALVAIPIYGRAESLNLAAAAAVCLYASAHAHHAKDR